MRRHLYAAFMLTLAASGPGAGMSSAGEERGTFDVYLRGIPAARISYASVSKSGRYAVTGRIDVTGLLAAVVNVSYEATARGRMRGDTYVPQSFEERRELPDSVSSASMGFRGGVPQVKVYDPPRGSDPHAVDPAGQRGTVDPMTVIFASLRDQPRERACALGMQVFDGKRRSQVTLGNPSPEDAQGRFTCEGEYRRIKGWSPEELAERTRFPFRMTYQRMSGDIYRVVEITTPTTLGNATLRRR